MISGQEVGIMLIDSRSSSAAFYPNEVPRILQRHQMKAKTNVSKAKSRRGFTLVEMIVVISMIAALAGISFPVYRSIQKKVEKQQFQMNSQALERAVDNFETEYNYLPYVSGATLKDGDEILDSDAERTAFTTILAGGESIVNFKKIKFFSCQEATGGPGNYVNGMVINADDTVSFYTPWGRQITIILIDTDMDEMMYTPWYGGQLTLSTKRIRIWDQGVDAQWNTNDDWLNFDHPTRTNTY